MRIVFFGTPELAVPSLEALAARHTVTAVVSQPDKAQGRSQKPVPTPVKSRAAELGIPVHQPLKLNDGAFESWLRDEAPDVCMLVAYGRILKQPILDVPTHGFLNMHPSLLPKYRGPSPIQSAILHGETETGVTIMRIDADMDAGDILLQRTYPIAETDTGESLTEKLAGMGAAMMVDALDALEQGTATFTPQNHADATYCHLIKKEHGRIHWADTAKSIHNKVRAFLPWPIAFSQLHAEVLRVIETHVIAGPAEAPPGTITAVNPDNIVVATGDGLISIDRLQAPGKRVMTAAEFLRGHALNPGERFTES